MTKTEIIVQLDAGKGEAVAGYVSGFLNARPCCSCDHFCRVLETFPHQGYNFLLLSLLWFDDLGLVKKPGYNLEASVELAKAACKAAPDEMDAGPIALMLPATDSTNFHRLKVVDGANEIDMVRALVCFLSWKEHTAMRYNDFVDTMRADHHTIQQSFTRLIMAWCRWVDKTQPTGSGDKAVVLARKICSCDRALPYI